MPGVWFSLKKSLQCKSDRQEVEDPESTRDGYSSSSRSLANHLKDVFLGSKRGLRNGNCSPCSIASNEFLNNGNMLQEAMILRDYSGFETKTIVGSFRECKSSVASKAKVRGTRYHGDVLLSPSKPKKNQRSAGFNGKITTSLIPGCKVHALNEVCTCLKYCSQRYTNIKSLQRYDLRSYAVSVLREGDSTRNVVEMIFKSSWIESKVQSCQIERVLKVNHTNNTLAKFEEYRDTVRATASKLAKKHQRCMADGNEVLSFHGTTIMCSLGIDGLSTPCNCLDCNVCNIITTGLIPSKQAKGKGIYTAATSLRAHNSISLSHDSSMYPVKRAMMVCRVIAGRVHKPPSSGSLEKFSIPVGFDSVAGEVESCSMLEELYISNPRGILPCFIVVYC